MLLLIKVKAQSAAWSLTFNNNYFQYLELEPLNRTKWVTTGVTQGVQEPGMLRTLPCREVIYFTEQNPSSSSETSKICTK